MSETLGPDPTMRTEPLPRPDEATEPVTIVGGDDAADTHVMAPLESGTAASIEDAHSRIEYHRRMAIDAERRRERAGSRMERMDHKIALYAEIGALAVDQLVSVETATGEPPRPRTGVERFIDKRADKRGLKESRAATYKYRQDKIYGTEPTLSGLNKAERRRHKLGVGRAQGTGEISAREAREARTRIDAQPLKLGELAHKRTGKAHRKAMAKTDRALDPLLVGQRWREMRREQAIGAIQTNHAKAEYHRRVLADLLRDAAEPTESTPTPEPPDDRITFYDYEAEGDFDDDDEDDTRLTPAPSPRPPRIRHAAGRHIEGNLLTIASRKPAELANDDGDMDEDEEDTGPGDTTLAGLQELFNRADEDEPEDTQEQDDADSKAASLKPKRSHDAPAARSSREAKLPTVDPWEVALKYTAHVRRYRAGDDDISMSDISIIKRLERDGVSEAEARRVYQRMMDEGIVDPWYNTPDDKGKSGGHRVLLTSDEILGRLKKK